VKDLCKFLETIPRPEGRLSSCCGIGINFYSVGEKRELCQSCPVLSLANAPHCRHLEFYAFLRVAGDGRHVVEADFACCLRGWSLEYPAECETCPDYCEAAQRTRNPVVAPVLA